MRNLKTQHTLALAVAAVGLGATQAMAASYNWDGGAGDMTWSSAVNWSGDVVPGSSDTVGFGPTGIADGSTIALGTSQTIGRISIGSWTFNGNSRNFTIGSSDDISNGRSLTLTDIYRGDNNGTGTITLASKVSLSGNADWNILNSGGFNVTGEIASASAVTLTKDGSQTVNLNGANTFSGNLRVLGGTVNLGGSNTYTGTTTASGGTIALNFAAAGASATKIIDPSSGLVLGGVRGGGTFTATGKGGASSSQTFASTTLNVGNSTLSIANGNTANTRTLFDLGAITRNTGATLNIVQPTGTNNTTPASNNGFTTSTGNSNGILGGYVTVGAADWAYNNGTNIVAYTGYTANAWSTGNNTNVTTSGAIADDSTTNSLRFNAAGAATVTLGGTNTIESGGILVTANVGNNLTTITGGSIRSGSADLVIHQHNTNNALTIASNIVDNNGTVLTKSGSGVLNLTGSLGHTGGTVVNSGTLNLVAGSTNPLSTAAPITISGGTLALGTGTTQSTSGDVVIQAGTLSGGTLTKSGAVYDVRGGSSSTILAGNVGLTKTTSGTFTFTNTSPNTYTGDTTILAGTVVGDGGATETIVINGNLIVGSPSGGPAASFLQNNGGKNFKTFNSNKTVTVYKNGYVDFGGGAQNLGSSSVVNIYGGTITGGQLYLYVTPTMTGGTWGGSTYGNVNSFTTLASSETAIISANLQSGQSTKTFSVADGAAATDLLLTGGITSGNVTKSGAGLMESRGSKAFSGVMSITGGTLRTTVLANGGSSSSIGAGTAAATNLVLGNGTTLQYTGTGHSTNRLFTVNGSAAGHGATLDASGTGAMVFTTGSGAIAWGTTGTNQSRVLTLAGSSSADNTLGLTINNNTGTGATVAVNKTGAGKWILSAANGYTGGTTISDGTLLIASTGSLGNTTVNVSGPNAVLGGNGTIGGATTIADGTLSPGASIGTLTFSNNLTINDTLLAELDAGDATVVASGLADKIAVGGVLTIGENAILDLRVLNAVPLDDTAYVIASYGSLAEGSVFGSGKVLNLPSGYKVDYHYNDLNQIAVVAVPEPATLSLLALGAVSLLRRRQRA